MAGAGRAATIARRGAGRNRTRRSLAALPPIFSPVTNARPAPPAGPADPPGASAPPAAPGADPAPFYAIGAGCLLIGVGAAGWALSDAASPVTALIPAAAGVLLLVCGLIARGGEKALKHAMHAAAMVGLLGFLAAAGRLGMVLAAQFDDEPPPVSTLGVSSLAAMAAICAVFVGLCVKSFRDARERRENFG